MLDTKELLNELNKLKSDNNITNSKKLNAGNCFFGGFEKVVGGDNFDI